MTNSRDGGNTSVILPCTAVRMMEERATDPWNFGARGGALGPQFRQVLRLLFWKVFFRRRVPFDQRRDQISSLAIMTTRRDTRVPPKPYQAAPDHWPSHLRYLHNPIPSPSSPSKLPLPLLIKYCSPSFPPPNAPPPLEIQLITSKNHPAFGQSGLFNSPDRELEKGTWIRDYIGVVYEEFEGREWSDYDLCLERGGTEIVGIDSEFAGNEARFVNDYRGIHEK